MISHPVASFFAPHAREGLYRAVAALEAIGIRLSEKDGPWIAGGALIRSAVHKQWPDNCDIDVFIHKDRLAIKDSFAVITLNLLVADGLAIRKQDPKAPESFAEKVYDFKYRDLNFQFILTDHSSLPQVLGSFDVNLSQIGTDGRTVWMADQCSKDLASKTVTCSRFNPKTEARIAKYVEALGFKPDTDTRILPLTPGYDY